ncbi:MAG: SRPBCC domain-containing protein [Vicinamibacteria bacterium]|jgi:uncharacterized protein YndB with AHSA1/START domain
MTDPGLEITRVFDASREQLWREWTEPERFADWYGGAEAECPLDTVSMDVTPGGRWRLTMLYGPDRREIRWKGEYREVVEPERLSFTVTDGPQDTGELVTVVLTDLGDGRTEMLMTQSGGGLSPDGYKAAAQGWGKFLDRMAERLAGG